MQGGECRSGSREPGRGSVEALILDCDLVWEAGTLDSRAVYEDGKQRTLCSV